MTQREISDLSRTRKAKLFVFFSGTIIYTKTAM